MNIDWELVFISVCIAFFVIYVSLILAAITMIVWWAIPAFLGMVGVVYYIMVRSSL